MDKNFKRSLLYIIPMMPTCIGGLGIADHFAPFDFMNGPFGITTSVCLVIFGIGLAFAFGLVENRMNG